MALFNTKIPSLSRQCMGILTVSGRPLSSKCFRYQVCPPKKNTYQVISRITPQLLEQLQKKSLGAGILQPGRLPHIFSTHPLNLPLVSPCQSVEGVVGSSDKLEFRCYFSTSAVHCKDKKKKGSKCKKKKKKKGGKCKKEKKKKCKLADDGPCPNIKLSNCAPTDSKVCTRDSPWPKCNRKCAPYPSYSESCHEDIRPPPSECRDCPYTFENHPTFKEKPKFYHTGPPITDGPLERRGAPIVCPGLRFGTDIPLRTPQGNLQIIPLIDTVIPAGGEGGFQCSKCDDGKDGESCGTKVKKCNKGKKKKKKKKSKKDKCKKKKDKKKKKPKKRKCNFKWRPQPCPPDDAEHSRRCPTDLIKPPKCP